MKPICIPTLNSEQLDALEKFYCTTREARLRTRAQMVLLLAAEQRLSAAAQISEIVRASEETVRRWLSSATSWPKESRDCATRRIRAPHAR